MGNTKWTQERYEAIQDYMNKNNTTLKDACIAVDPIGVKAMNRFYTLRARGKFSPKAKKTKAVKTKVLNIPLNAAAATTQKSTVAIILTTPTDARTILGDLWK